MFTTFAKFIAPSGMLATVLWDDETVVRERLGHGVSDLKMTRRHYNFTYPFPQLKWWSSFVNAMGPPIARSNRWMKLPRKSSVQNSKHYGGA